MFPVCVFCMSLGVVCALAVFCQSLGWLVRDIARGDGSASWPTARAGRRSRPRVRVIAGLLTGLSLVWLIELVVGPGMPG